MIFKERYFIFRDIFFKFGLALILKKYLLIEVYMNLKTWNLRKFNLCE
jgi:hypothetical protein